MRDFVPPRQLDSPTRLALSGTHARRITRGLRTVTLSHLGIIAGSPNLSTAITATADLRACATLETLLSIGGARTKAERRSRSLWHKRACAGGQPRASQRHPPLRTRGLTDRFGRRRPRPAPAPKHHRVCQGGRDRRIRGRRPPAVRGRQDRKCFLVLPPKSAVPNSSVLYLPGTACLDRVLQSTRRFICYDL
jgi:hypothetical protein